MYTIHILHAMLTFSLNCPFMWKTCIEKFADIYLIFKTESVIKFSIKIEDQS